MKKLHQIHLDRWAVLMEYQKGTPFTPTLSEISSLWGFDNKSSPRNTIQILLEHGYILSHKNKRYSMYLAIDPFEKEKR